MGILDTLTGIGASVLKDPTALGQFMGNYRYPSDLTSGAGRNFYIDIQFQKYQRRSIFMQPFMQAMGGIQLPIPNTLNDVTLADWKPEAQPIVGAAIENALAQTGNDLSKLKQAGVSEAVSLSNQTLQNLIAGGTVSALNNVGSILGSATGINFSGMNNSLNAALQLVGKSQNPFLTMMFKQPSFKEHSFQWRLAPRNAQESETIKQIILAFKANMLPAMAPGSGGIFLTYPNMAMISFYPAQDFLYKFKPCVVTSFGVNYNGGGQPSFFRGTNAPTLIELSVRFLEIEYFLREDIVDPGIRAEGSATPISGNLNPSTQTPPLITGPGGRVGGGGP